MDVKWAETMVSNLADLMAVKRVVYWVFVMVY